MKLIRDRVRVDDGGTEAPPVAGIERILLLGPKLQEEAAEARFALDGYVEVGAPYGPGLQSELADVAEVLRAIAKELPGGWGEVERIRKGKLAERGGFDLGRRYISPDGPPPP